MKFGVDLEPTGGEDRAGSPTTSSRSVWADLAHLGYDDDRWVHGIAVRYGVEVLTSMNRDGTEQAYVTFEAGSFDGHLGRMAGNDVTQIRLDVNHEVGIGRLLAVSTTDRLLRITGEVKDSPAGDTALNAVLDGTLRGFSVEARIRRYSEHGERDGIPIIRVTQADLVAVAMALDPADPLCVIDRASDEVPAASVQAEQDAREAVLGALRPVPKLMEGESEYRWGLGFGPR